MLQFLEEAQLQRWLEGFAPTWASFAHTFWLEGIRSSQQLRCKRISALRKLSNSAEYEAAALGKVTDGAGELGQAVLQCRSSLTDQSWKAQAFASYLFSSSVDSERCGLLDLQCKKEWLGGFRTTGFKRHLL